MIAIIVSTCRDCPFVIVDQLPWLCSEPSLGDGWTTPIETSVRPPVWCPLREADRLVTLRVK